MTNPTLTSSQYDKVISRMEASRYAHIQRAAGTFAQVADAKAAVETRRPKSIRGRIVADFSDEELLAEADLEIENGQQTHIARRLPPLGIEFLIRRLSAAGRWHP